MGVHADESVRGVLHGESGSIGHDGAKRWRTALLLRWVTAEITPFLWFESQAEAALDFYSSVFANSKIVNVAKVEDPLMPNGGFILGTITIENLTITAFNGGPAFVFTEAISLFVSCENQQEVDYYWSALLDGGSPQRCGWLKDRFGISWQIVPTLLGDLMSDPDQVRASRVREAMLGMVKLESGDLLKAFNGVS